MKKRLFQSDWEDEFEGSDYNPFDGKHGLHMADEGDGGGTGGAGKGAGGDEGSASKGDAKSEAGAKDAGSKAGEQKLDTQTYKVKIGGVEKQLTLDELTEYASKAAGADEKFREAAELRKEAASAKELTETFNKVFNSDDVKVSDVRKLAELVGQDPDQMEALFKEEVEAGKGKGNNHSAGAKIKPEDLPDEVQDVLRQAREDQVRAAEIEIARQVAAEVDKDKFFGKIIDETPEEQRENRKAAVTAMVQRDVRTKILASPYTKEKFGTEMIRNSIQEIRAEVTKFGIPSKSDKQLNPSLLAALGPTGGLPAEVHSDADIKRVSSTEDNYEDNVVARLGQRMVQAINGRRRQ